MQSLRYLAYIFKHKFYVWRAGRLIAVSPWRLLIHDWSKFTPREFGAYQRRFFAGKAGTLDKERDPADFHRAWTHHWHLNPHHWEHWLRMGRKGFKPMVMPEKFIREMIADWMGASRAITGDWNAARWYIENKEKILLHPDTRLVTEILLSLADLRINGPQSDRVDLSKSILQASKSAAHQEVC